MKPQISVDGADRRIARVHGTRCGPLSTKLQWHVGLGWMSVVQYSQVATQAFIKQQCGGAGVAGTGVMLTGMH